MKQVFFYSADKPVNTNNRGIYQKLIKEIFIKEGKPLKKIDFIFCSDEYLLKLNNQYLNHNYYTDIITFLLSTDKQPIESEIYISTDRVKENAKNYNEPYQKELLRVMIHGSLHLCNYKDKSRDEKKIMRKKEVFYINLYEKGLYKI